MYYGNNVDPDQMPCFAASDLRTLIANVPLKA